MPHTLIVSIFIAEGQFDNYLKHAKVIQANAAANPKIHHFILTRETANPNNVKIFEQYEDESVQKAFFAEPVFQNFMKEWPTLFAKDLQITPLTLI